MAHDTNRPQTVATALRFSRHAATMVAAGRVALGVAALTWPSVPGRPWVGASADELGAQVFGRALGARDLALGLGALTALRKAPHPGPGPDPAGSDPVGSGTASACAWLAAGALADALDAAITAAAWPRLPQTTRWLVAAAAGGAAVAGAAGALAVLLDGPSRQNRTEEADLS